MGDTPATPPSKQQQARSDRAAKLKQREAQLLQNLERVKKQQLELARTAEEREARRKRQAILLGLQLQRLAAKDPQIAQLVVRLIDTMNQRDQAVLASVRDQFANNISDNV